MEVVFYLIVKEISFYFMKIECFGCPKLNHCCRLDIFGHCIACASWKACCWKNIDPLCIAKQDGCHVIRAQAEKELAVKEVSREIIFLKHS